MNKNIKLLILMMEIYNINKIKRIGPFSDWKANGKGIDLNNNFDDGNFQYANYTNSWIIFGDWQGKYALVNYMNPEVIIKSISSWKVIQI